jgi:hypothetical protein
MNEPDLTGERLKAAAPLMEAIAACDHLDRAVLLCEALRLVDGPLEIGQVARPRQVAYMEPRTALMQFMAPSLCGSRNVLSCVATPATWAEWPRR